MNQIEGYVVVAAAIFGLNLLPAFGPPTWAVLVLFHLNGDFRVPVLVAVGAVAAASGRLVLAQGTRWVGGYLSEQRRNNLRAAGDLVTERRGRTVAVLGLFAVSPLPSAQLFEAVGLMSLRLLPVTAAFFVGRTVSYSLYVGGAQAIRNTDTGKVLLSSLTSPWGVGLEVAMIAALVLLARVDWVRLLRGRVPR